ncbi:MAG: NADH-quinone oxidoreductase subunit NuoF [Chloroflexota bacterium]|nr:NADH-quinone oxidoreductase subunit NuoF [Chloroflexota bacterium]
MDFEHIKAKAILAWEEFQASEIPKVLVGTATCGRAAGALSILDVLKTEIERQQIQATIVQVGCIGMCSLEPLVVISKPDMPSICYHNVDVEMASRLVSNYLNGDEPCFDLALGTLEWDEEKGAHIPELSRFEYESRLILRRCGYVDPENIDHYIATGGYEGLNCCLKNSPENIIDIIEASGLRGRGGAGYPTGRKWRQCRNAGGSPKYVVCNADEGDPGAFMDRVVLESDPHQTVEGMIIAGYAIGTPQGYIYIRSEYPLAIRCLTIAMQEARELGLLGSNILGSGYDFDIELIQGAGAFVCGEASALMYSIEGKRGMPRTKPPRSVEAGLWKKPTVLNNVKTFASVPAIIKHGSEQYASIGTENSKGTAVFALAGKVKNTGLAEVPMGTTLRELVFDVGGGISEDQCIKAVQIGGPSGGCIPDSLLDTPIDFESLTEAGSMMGSGGVIVLDTNSCMVDAARFFLDFSQKESCGKCTMCRLGTKQMLETLEDIVNGRGKLKDIDLLVDLSHDIKAGSLCGLGKTAPNPVLTTIRYFRDEYEAHILEQRCSGLVCPEFISYYILPDKCERACEHCKLVCPTEAIFANNNRIKVIDQSKCVKCGSCLNVCPPEYDAVIKVTGEERARLGLIPTKTAI